MTNADIVLSIVLTTLLILLLVSGIVISFFVTSRQNARQRASLAEAQLRYQKELRQVEVEVSETLMQKFAQELHDNIGQILTCIHLEVENKKFGNPVLQSELKQVGLYLGEATEQLKLLSRSLNSEYVAHVGLRKAIELELSRQEKLGKFAVSFTTDGVESSLDSNQELVAFRIFQEVVHNAMKHSSARHLKVKLSFDPHFTLEITDDGVGFDYQRMMNSEHASGIRNIMRRAAMAKITCQVLTQPRAGCQYIMAYQPILQTAFAS